MGGTLSIETAETAPQILVQGEKVKLNFGAQVVVKIATAGCGIQAEKCTALLKQMVERTGGKIEVSTDTVAGNVFRLFLPRILPLNE
jgi:hypothetical protein